MKYDNLTIQKLRELSILDVADKLGFYVPELQQMERSLEECRPFAADEDILAKVRNLSEKKLPQFDFSELATAHTPVYDEDDNLAHA